MKDNSGKKYFSRLNGSDGINGFAKTKPAHEPIEENSIRRHVSNSRQFGSHADSKQEEDSNPGRVLSAKISAIVAKYPFHTIGGLLALLLVILLFKTFYQGKHWKAKRTAEEAFYVANEYARNNSTNLYPYLSNAFRREVRQLPGLLPLSMQTATRGGTITAAEAVGIREITPDSVVVEVHLTFGGENSQAKHEEKSYQTMVYEKDQWRLGLTYSR
ncbi:hypothetical protein [Telluribacter humicola]|uniref:hypothetical protein n=1 Tax=Telluribacter humicola TaxID=1720261 RepID=UPI001E494555|nr:hypothetical protein [Telluribacter humicola]